MFFGQQIRPACVAVAPSLDLAVCGVTFARSEIQDLGVSALGHKKIGRLDVAVDDPAFVRRIKSIGNFDGQATSTVSISIGCVPMRCFRVMPSRNSMAMKGCPC